MLDVVNKHIIVSVKVALNISTCGERHRPFNHIIFIYIHNNIGELLSQE